MNVFNQRVQILSRGLGLVMNHEEQAEKMEQFDIRYGMSKLAGKCFPLWNLLIEMVTC